jgi:hypothetical protein
MFTNARLAELLAREDADMAEAEYIAITDHAKGLKTAGGSTSARLNSRRLRSKQSIAS